MCEKYTKDGKTAILISEGFGAGWSTWEGSKLSYDKRVVQKFLEGASETEMHDFLRSIGYGNVYMGGYKSLTVRWLPVGTKYVIHEYDGAESIRTIDSFEWMTA